MTVLPTTAIDQWLFSQPQTKWSPALLKNSIDVCPNLSNPWCSSNFLPPLILYRNSIKPSHITVPIPLSLTRPTILLPPALIDNHIEWNSPFCLMVTTFFVVVTLVARSIPSVGLSFCRLNLPPALAPFMALAVSLASCCRNTSSVSMTRAFLRHRRSPVFIFHVWETFARNCLWVSCSISFSIIICWRPFDKESIIVRNSCAGVASPFTIFTPCLTNSQMLRKVRGVVEICVQVCFVGERLVLLRESKTRLGFKGCMQAAPHAFRMFSSVYARFCACSNILYFN